MSDKPITTEEMVDAMRYDFIGDAVIEDAIRSRIADYDETKLRAEIYESAATKALDERDALKVLVERLLVDNDGIAAQWGRHEDVMMIGVLDAVEWKARADGVDIVRWEWNFGDGGFSIEQNPVHSYAHAGSYVVTLTIWNSEGASTQASMTI